MKVGEWMKRVSETIFTCDKCLKDIKYTTKDEYDPDFVYAANQCWSIHLGRAGYGSKLDGSEINFDICDDCLIEFIQSFSWEGKERAFNSGSNQYLSSEEWIRYQKGEMSKEEMIDLGFNVEDEEIE